MTKYKCDNCHNEFSSEQQQSIQCPNCFWSSSVKKIETNAPKDVPAEIFSAQDGGQAVGKDVGKNVDSEIERMKQGAATPKKGNGVGFFVAIILAVIFLAAVLPNLNRARENASQSNNPTRLTKVQGENGLLKEYYANGHLKSEGVFKNGQYEGLLKLYYEDGKLSSETYYGDKGVVWGKMYRENGQLYAETVPEDGKPEGRVKIYDANGQIVPNAKKQQGAPGGQVPLKKSHAVLAFMNEQPTEEWVKRYGGSDAWWTPMPKADLLYRLDWTQPMQKLADGYLIKGDTSAEVVFLYTDKDIPEGQFLNGYWAQYVGAYEYQSTRGFPKKVPAFKLVDDATERETRRQIES